MIRTSKVPFLQSKPSLALFISSLIVTVVAFAIGFTTFAVGLDMVPLPIKFIPWLTIILVSYLLCVQLIKKWYIKRYGEWM